MTSVKYKCDSKNLTDTFAKMKKLLMEELIKGAVVNPSNISIDNQLLWLALTTLLCCYNVFKFHQIIHTRHRIARPLGRDMGSLLWVTTLISIMPQFLQRCVQYDVILDHIIMVFNCSWCYEYACQPIPVSDYQDLTWGIICIHFGDFHGI